MSTKYRDRYCRYCKRHVLALADRPNILSHFLVSIMTCGLWLPIGLGAMSVTHYRCSRCGRHV